MAKKRNETHLSPEGVWHRKSTVDPAESIDNVCWDAIYDAANWLANVLGGGNNQTTCEQQHRCERVVQPKDSAVYLNVLPFQVRL